MDQAANLTPAQKNELIMRVCGMPINRWVRTGELTVLSG
jgi:hypothetical protein